MRGLNLDYQRRHGNITLPGAIVCALAVGVLMLTMLQYRRLGAESLVLEARLQQYETRMTPRATSVNMKSDARTLAAEVKQANQVLGMLGLRWDNIFGAVAAAHREGVALLAMAPEPGKGIVKISAEAKNFSVMLDYVQRLEAQPALDEVYLQSHNLANHNPQKPVRFIVTANWLDK